jgi:hypothetical protein
MRGGFGDAQLTPRRRIALAFAVAITTAVFAFSLLPWRQKAFTTGVRAYPIEIGDGAVIFLNLHRIAHWTAFAVITIAFSAAARRTGVRVAIAAAALGLAWFIEWAEAFLYHSGFERYDVRDDAIGILAGLILIQLAMTVWKRAA